MDWRSWCRLCGNYETIVKIEPEVEDIAAKLCVFTRPYSLGEPHPNPYRFQLLETNFKICIECNQFLNEIYQFVTRTRIIDEMFMEIAQVEQQQMIQQQQLQNPESPELLIQDEMVQSKELNFDVHIVGVRDKYGLKPLVPVETLSGLFDEQDNIAGALEIKLESDIEDFDAQDALSDDQEENSESSEEEEEDESEIEQLSDSQLRKHEESRSELSESGRDERQKRKKKYRKSDEEKLFE